MKKEHELEILINQIEKRGYPVERLSGTTEQVEALLELDARNVFRAFYAHSFEAEQYYTVAALKHFWSEEDAKGDKEEASTIISYLFDKKPC